MFPRFGSPGAKQPTFTKEDIFYYVDGVLHSPEVRARFASDLKKMLPRIPFTRETADFRRFSQAGRDMARWHPGSRLRERGAVARGGA